MQIIGTCSTSNIGVVPFGSSVAVRSVLTIPLSPLFSNL